ncbi:MAG: hypothetical protein V1822_02085, partial [Candidatus Micrarchaeota archaeon]
KPAPPQGGVASTISESEGNLLTEPAHINEQKQEAATIMADELLNAYAKENHKWLYEIYRMGGLSLEEYRKRIKEKMEDDRSGKTQQAADEQKAEKMAENKAFSNLSKSADKKFKK